MSVEWSEFAQRLGRELAGLERDTILIVREREESRHYVQAMREPDRLYAEAVGNNFLEGPLLLTLADEEVMSDAGWRPPADPAPRNWWTELPSYATAADHDRLADVMVTALRDVQGVRRPSDLVYESFHRHGSGLIELLDFGIETADPARVTKRRHTSLEPESRTGVPALAAPVPDDPDTLEPRLADAKSRGDHTTYFDLLLSADLVLPATGPAVEDPDTAEFPTTMIGGGTYVVVFTSPQALVRSGHRPGLYRRTSFAQLTLGWPDPSWHLAINPGLPSEVHLDPSAVARLDATQRALNHSPARAIGPGPAGGPALPGVPGAQSDAAPRGAAPAPTTDPTPPDGASAPSGTHATENHVGPVTGPHSPDPPGLPSVPGDPGPAGTPGDPHAVAGAALAAEGGAESPGVPGHSAGPAAPGVPAVDPAADGAPPADGIPGGAEDAPVKAPGIPLRPPHGTRLWQWDGEGEESDTAVPAAVFDALTGTWTPVRADAVRAPRTD
jgi:SseB protein N-terminal domain